MCEGARGHLHLIVDANSLQLLDKSDEAMATASAGTGKTLLCGDLTITTNITTNGTTNSTTSRRGATFTMRDPPRSINDATGLKNRTSGNGTTFTDPGNIRGNNATTDIATAGTDAHHALALTGDFHNNTFGRNGIDNAGKTTFFRGHHSNESKRAVASVFGRKFPGCIWVARQGEVMRRVADKPMQTFKQRVRQLTRHSGRRSMQQVVDKLRSDLSGWKAYFRLAQTPRVWRALDEGHATGCTRFSASSGGAVRPSTVNCGRGVRCTRSQDDWRQTAAAGGATMPSCATAY